MSSQLAPTIMIETNRLRLRMWQETDRDAFAKLNEDSIVMADLGGPFNRELSDAKFDRYRDAFQLNGYGRCLVETLSGYFVGYCGVMLVDGEHPLGRHNEIGWRLHREAWGKGYATEAAAAVLRDAFLRVKLGEVLAYTATDNLRSQAVMQRLSLRRDDSKDFEIFHNSLGTWRGLVWTAIPTFENSETNALLVPQ